MKAWERLAALTAVKAEVAAAIDAAKADVMAELEEGDRKVARLEGVEVGQVTVTRGSHTAFVADERALLEWIDANVPDRTVSSVELTPEVRATVLRRALEDATDGQLKLVRKVDPAFLAGLLKDVQEGRIDVPGVAVQHKPGFIQTRQKPEEAARVGELWRAGVINPLAIGGTSD